MSGIVSYSKREVDRKISELAGSGGIAGVASVDGQSGAVVLSGVYATIASLTTGLATKAPTTHSHAIGDVTGLVSALSSKQATGDYATNTALTTGLATKAALSHTHTISDITALQTALDGKQASGSYASATHTHAIGDVTGLTSALATITGKAAISGQVFTGAISATNLSGTNTGDQDLSPYATTTALTTGLATKATPADIDSRIATLVGTAPVNLDTLQEIAAQLATDESAASALTTTVAAKLAKASNLSDLTSADTALTNLGATTFSKRLITAANAATAQTALGLGNAAQAATTDFAPAAGSTSITALGTVATGVWSGTAIGVTKGGTGLTTIASGKLLYASASNTLAELTVGGNLSTTGGTLNIIDAPSVVKYLTATDTGSVGPATYTPDASVNGEFWKTVTGNLTLAAPTNLTDKQSLVWRLTMNATGGYSLTWSSAFRWPGNTTPTFDSTASKTVYYAGIYDATSGKIDMFTPSGVYG